MTSQLETLFNKSNFAKIIAIHKNRTIISELSAQDQLRIVASYFRASEYDAAIKLIEEIAPFQGNSPDYLNIGAISYRKIGQSQKAYEMLLEAEEMEPDSIQIKSNKANILMDLGRLDEAKTLLTEIIRNNPEFEDAKINMSRAHHIEQGQINKDKIQSAQEELISYSKDPLLFAFEKDTVAEDLKRYQTVKATNKIDNSAESRNKLDEILLGTDENQNFSNETVKLSTIANQQNNIDESLKLSSIAHLREKEINPIILANVSDSYVAKMRFKEAEIYALHSIINGNANTSIYLNLCTLCIMRADYKLAKYYLNQAIILDPSHPNIEFVSNSLKEGKRKTPESIKFDELWSKESELEKC